MDWSNPGTRTGQIKVRWYPSDTLNFFEHCCDPSRPTVPRATSRIAAAVAAAGLGWPNSESRTPLTGLGQAIPGLLLVILSPHSEHDETGRTPFQMSVPESHLYIKVLDGLQELGPRP